ncbi:putative late blight resistance protein homolog R1B-16 [Salvia splendens]|uniref:putative late blight resistance protein homolog R1B-16 n=1 Tax=Salvia splendens TaxID=180675 RepID=UPI001C25E47F|nr:putative late blight resistance protein homolog R1B-16 [Salvia splendens]XP_042005675.1 putative late blight resistance protein homolog R1B-16 [Salvia splendens]
MAYEAVGRLPQTLLQILQRHDDAITPPVKQQIISIHDKALVLELNLNHFHFAEQKTIGKAAIATEGIIQYLFSAQYLSNCKSKDPSGRLSNHLGKLAKELDSIVVYIVDYCNSVSLAVSSSSTSVLKSHIEDPMVTTELIAMTTNRLRRLAEKFKSTAGELADEDSSDSPSTDFTSSIPESPSKCYVADFDEDPSDSYRRDHDVVGFDEDILQMMDRIIDDSSYLQILPIFGMGGIGKSTLAKAIYDHPLVKQHFDIRGWVTISQDYSMPNILSQLLASLKGKVYPVGRDSFKVAEAEKLEIYKILSGRRYLIVMDDIWSVEAWECVRWLFPNNHNSSRIILTTRLMDVATYVSWNIHMMRFLDDEQSWRLFQRKVFSDQDCPHELRSVGEKIVRGCGGLPLSIVTVAGILSRIPRTPKLWQQTEVNDGQLVSILSLSYNYLPPYLRKCFLYMAAFPQDYDIHASELIKLWVAEGFIKQQNASKSEEMAAEECLEELIKQSLVLTTSRKSDGKTKSCKLHSMVRDFCVRQAGQEKVLLSVMDYFPNLILRRHFLPQVLQNHHRVSVSWHDLHLKDSTHSSCTASIICIPQRGYRPKGSVQNFTSLRVLHVLRRNDHSYWELGEVFKFISLTYLASYIPDSIIPPTIAKLQNLQTLIIYRSEVRLPLEIWSLRQLRHLIAFSFCPLLLPEGAMISLDNLQTLSMATNFVCSGRMVQMIPNIKKLGICYPETKFSAGYYYLQNLTRFRQLEKLKMEMHSSSAPRLTLAIPKRLKKLELSGRWSPWRAMTYFHYFGNLQVLKLKNYALSWEQWETTEGQFINLIRLLIDESNLKCWRTKWTHFPRLQCLMLHRCPYLDEIPYDIGKIPSLQLIEIDDHNQSLLCSAKKIQEEQRGRWGKEDLKVIVKPS